MEFKIRSTDGNVDIDTPREEFTLQVTGNRLQVILCCF